MKQRRGCLTDDREMDVVADPRSDSDLAFVAAFVFELDVAVFCGRFISNAISLLNQPSEKRRQSPDLKGPGVAVAADSGRKTLVGRVRVIANRQQL